MKRKTAFYLTGALMLVAFAGFSYQQFTDALTPYVPYEQAITATRTVQVAGGLQKNSSSYDTTEGRLHFTLVDPENAGKTLAVRYEGVKPANFEDAVSIVAIGRWDEASSEFAAQDLLVKCPSKYQGLDEYETKSYSAADGQATEATYGEPVYGEQSYGDAPIVPAAAGDEG
ncbi:MAG: cytochrome c maturation protein CcmE [Acidobacteriota bacterium]